MTFHSRAKRRKKASSSTAPEEEAGDRTTLRTSLIKARTRSTLSFFPPPLSLSFSNNNHGEGGVRELEKGEEKMGEQKLASRSVPFSNRHSVRVYHKADQGCLVKSVFSSITHLLV